MDDLKAEMHSQFERINHKQKLILRKLDKHADDIKALRTELGNRNAFLNKTLDKMHGRLAQTQASVGKIHHAVRQEAQND